MCLFFRAPFLIALLVTLVGVNVYAWRTSGINHVLIFQLDPSDHITEQNLYEIGFVLAIIWALCMLGFVFAPDLGLEANMFPLINVLVYILFLCNPINLFQPKARLWLINVLVCSYFNN